MITQIQTYFSHFLTKLVALALFLFILTSFNLQIITANAQAKPPAKSTTNTGTTTGTNILTQKQVDERIGTLKNCTVNEKNESNLKSDPTYANKFVFDCLKDIIQIVITISVILAIMRLIFVGIRFLNTFEDEGKLQGELAKAITGFVAGAVILGLFAAIINVVNPSALRIDKIFSAQVIADYRCLNKGISDNVKGAEVNSANCKDVKQGSGPGGTTTQYSDGIANSAELDRIISSDKQEDQQKKALITSAIKLCNSSIIFNSVDQVNDCTQYQNITGQVGSSVDAVLPPNIDGDAFANGDYTDIKVETNTVTATYTAGKNSKPKKITFWINGSCADSPFRSTPPPTTIKRTEVLNKQGCILKDVK